MRRIIILLLTLVACCGLQAGITTYTFTAKNWTSNPANGWTSDKDGESFETNTNPNFQNGVKVLSYTLADKSWVDLIQTSKFSQQNWPLAYEIMKDCGKDAGYFGMQDHGDEVWYRNIRVKVLK